MVPKFPLFKKLEIADQAYIENFTRRFEPYSDYNFVSLWSWNTRDQVRISELNGNLVVRFSDYLTGIPFYSFLGEEDVDVTAGQLLRLTIDDGIFPTLKLVPMVSANLFNNKIFQVTEDPDNFDYILSVDRLKTFSGTKLSAKRNYSKRFNQKYTSKVEILDFNNKDILKKAEALFRRWVVWKKFERTEVENEFIALSRFYELTSKSNVFGLGVYIEEGLVGFSFYEILGKGFALSHFEKADAASLVGIYPFIMQKTAEFLSERGVKYINFEQDLGISGLKEAKKDYAPVSFLKKYIVSYR